MKLFEQLVKTAVNVAKLPVDVVVDAATMCETGDRSRVAERLREIKKDVE